MSSNNFISELQGAFSWIEKMRDQKQMSSYEQIQELFLFLNIDATKEEIEALHELANPYGEKNIKFEYLQKVFQYDKQSELKDIVQAYSHLANGEPTLSLDKLENYLKVYDKKYKNSTIALIQSLRESPYCKDGLLDYISFLKQQQS